MALKVSTLELRDKMQDAQKAIWQHQRDLNKRLPINHEAILRLGMSIGKIERNVSAIANPSLREAFALLNDDFECLRIRVRILAERNRVSARHALLNQGTSQPVFASVGSFLNVFGISDLSTMNKACHAVKASSIKNQLRQIRCLHVKDLIRYANALGRPRNWAHVFSFCKGLEEFDFTCHFNSKPVDNDIIREILQHLPPTISILNFDSTDIDDPLLQFVADKFQRLTSVGLRNCPNIRMKSIAYLGNKHPDILKLNIGDLGGLSASCLRPFRNLKELDVRGCQLDLGQVTSYCPGLTHLNARGWLISDIYSCRAIAANCPELQHLELSAQNYDHPGCMDLAAKCPQLSHFALQCFTPPDPFLFNAFLTAAPQIRVIDIHSGNNGSIANARKCSEWLKLAKQYPAIAEKTSSIYVDDKVSDQDITRLTVAYPHVRELQLQDISLLTDAGITQIATSYKQQLTKLFMVRCPSLTDNSLRILGQNCPRLYFIILDVCKITPDGIRDLLNRCNLKHLRLDNASFTTVNNGIATSEKRKIQKEFPHVVIT